MPIAWAGLFANLTQPLSMSYLTTRQHEAEASATALRNATDLEPLALASCLYEAGQCAFLRGQGDVALSRFSEAYQVAPLPLLRIAQIQAFLFNGEYRAMYTALGTLADARLILPTLSPPDPVLQPLIDGLRGLSARDHHRLAEARYALSQAEVGLREQQLKYDYFVVQLGLVEVLTRAELLIDAQVLLNKLDEDMKLSQHQWFRPDWWARQAHVLWAQGLREAVAKAARRGLGAVTDYGSSRALSELYRLLALTMGSTPPEIENAQDARQRAVEAARAYSSRLELGRALFTIGLHTKLFATRATDRARGSGFIYEAEQLYRQMDMPIPSTTVTTVPLL